MSDWLVHHAAFLAVVSGFALLLLAERAPVGAGARPGRLLANFGLGIINLALGLILPVTSSAAAGLAAAWGWHPLGALPGWTAAVALFLGATGALYALHRLSHALPWLWRFHRVHHADPAVDLSTGLRTHPVEAVLASAVVAAVVLALGSTPGDVALLNAALLLGAFWEHAALTLPPAWSRRLEWIAVTPDFHRMHHSTERAVHDRNFGTLTTLWDRLGNSYAAPAPVPELGLREEHATAASLLAQLTRPFTAPV